MSNKRAALYVRVSTDVQTVENQIRELRQVAGRRGWDVAEVYNDAGISGAKGRNGRPGLDSMLNDARRRKFDIVMAWAIDRLGRSLIDLLDTIQHLEACGVDLYLDQQAIDTTTPMGRLVFQVTGAFAEFERTMIRQRIKAGLKRAVAQGVKLGRPKIDRTTERKVRQQLARGGGILKVAKSLGIGTGTVQRIANELRSPPGVARRAACERARQTPHPPLFRWVGTFKGFRCFCLCIKSRADALANLPVPGQGGFRESGMWPLRQPNGDATRQPSSVRNRWRVFHGQIHSQSQARVRSEGP